MHYLLKKNDAVESKLEEPSQNLEESQVPSSPKFWTSDEWLNDYNLEPEGWPVLPESEDWNDPCPRWPESEVSVHAVKGSISTEPT